MPRLKSAEGFDVNGTAYEPSVHSLIKQFTEFYRCPDPTLGFDVSCQGDRLAVKCHSYEQNMTDPGHFKLVIDGLEDAIDQYLGLLKKSVKENGGGALGLKEIRGMRDHNLNKVSLNDRWNVILRRVFTLEDLESFPED